MGLFDKIKKEINQNEEDKQDIGAVGWDAITEACEKVYPTQKDLYSGQTGGIDTKMQSNITGFITIPDQQLKTINTPNGKVDFVEFIGATNNELVALKNKMIDVKSLYEKIGSDITSYNRKSVM